MSDHHVKRRKKLIEVAIPLEAINAASAREKSIRHGHPSTLHLYWARRPLAAARAVIFSQIIDDPSAVPEEFPTQEAQENERLRLFALISELVAWENTTNEAVLKQARAEISRSWHRCCDDNAEHPHASILFDPLKIPDFHDPFAGGGALPLEAMRLGLNSFASDLNPVAVLINKATIEIPPRFSDRPPVNPDSKNDNQIISRKWKGAEGLASDLHYYGNIINERAFKDIGKFYPNVIITPELIENQPDLERYKGRTLKTISWIWARTVLSPNPMFSSIEVPLISSYILSRRPRSESYLVPRISGSKCSFEIGHGPLPSWASQGTKTSSRGSTFRCILSGDLIDGGYIKDQAAIGKMGEKLIAVVLEGDRQRVFIPPIDEHENIAKNVPGSWAPESEFYQKALGFGVGNYGMKKWSDLFTKKQLLAHSTFCDLINEISIECEGHARVAMDNNDDRPLSKNGAGAFAYSEAIKIYLSFALDRVIDRHSSLATWDCSPSKLQLRNTFSRQALQMTWDYADGNIFSNSSGTWLKSIDWVAMALESLCTYPPGLVQQASAGSQDISALKIVSTDPPYYDNIGYADLADFFYVWLRRTLKDVYPELLATVSTPKNEELVATPARHGGRSGAEKFFLAGMTNAMVAISRNASPCFPITIYYAFKQAETKGKSGNSSTGWETFLEAVINSGLSVIGTWPVRTELAHRIRSNKSNALASSIVLVCQKKIESAPSITRAEFRRRLSRVVPASVKELEKVNIAPVDIAQAAIGPGMAIYSTADAVLKSDDSKMSVREALIEINSALDEYLSQDEGDLDADSRFALTFFESFGYEKRDFGDAEGLAKARNISVEGVCRAGILHSVSGKTWLLNRDQLPDDWDPASDNRLCVWEATQHLIKMLEAEGEASAAALLSQLKNVPGQGELASNCRALAYRLYNHCEKRKQTEEARAYNGLVIAWPELQRLAASQASASASAVQTSLI